MTMQKYRTSIMKKLFHYVCCVCDFPQTATKYSETLAIEN